MRNENVAQQKLPMKVHLICGWPLALVVVGGVIGGVLGGVAYAANLAIYKSRMSERAKIALNVLVGASAIAIWAIIAVLIQKTQTP